MNAAWKERGLPKITEQRLCDQARAIRKTEWFTSVELDEIRRRMITVDEELEEQDAGCIDTEPEQVDELNGDVKRADIQTVIRMRKVIVVPVVIGALGTVSVNFKEYMKRIGVNVRLEVIQKTALLGTAKILRKVLSL